MADPEVRVERDSMGEVTVPAGAYYGASTERARQNFPISNLRMPRRFIRALAQIKGASAVVNAELGLLEARIANAIQQAAEEVEEGKFDKDFVVDVVQTGAPERSRQSLPVEQRRHSDRNATLRAGRGS